MSDRMIPISFEALLNKILREYKESKSFMQVPVKETDNNIQIGPAAGPHTQLAGNIIAAFAAGANCFELKTVQILDGEALDIKKPCIYVAQEVYNTEWSTELTVKEAQDEYIKAYLLIKLLGKEFGLNTDNISFVMSVGYDLAGIKSEKVDSFLENMKNAEKTDEWKKDLRYIEENIGLFKNVTLDYLKGISPEVSKNITISTMHGCRPEEIEKIAIYLMKDKGLNTFIKMNPTLAGKENIINIFKEKGYDSISFNDDIFKVDISLEQAVEIIKNCKTVAEKEGLDFGIKLTNTFPVLIQKGELYGSDMYMSGPALYPISIHVAALLAEKLNGDISISYSGGVDTSNIVEIVESGINPITVCSYLLKSGGYKNITKLINKVSAYNTEKEKDNEKEKPIINLEKLKALAQYSKIDENYNSKKLKNNKLDNKDYNLFCAKCNNCVDVCPNRANIKVTDEGKSYVIHNHDICNECGCCVHSCIMGRIPYKEKFYISKDNYEFNSSCKNGALYGVDGIRYMKDGRIEEVPEAIQSLIEVGLKKGCI